jgi:glutamine cyclotransferase
MKISFSGYFPGLILLIVLSWIISCSGSKGKLPENSNHQPASAAFTASKPSIKLVSPDENASYKLGNEIKVKADPDDKTLKFDSVRVYYDGRLIKVIKSEPWECSVDPSFTTLTGRRSVKAVGYTSNKTESVTRFVIIYSDIRPKKLSYSVVRKYPHDREAFTQGLFYDKGVLYEGTGQESGSSLREVQLETGKVIRQHNLDASLFGEGITLFKDRIYQVTWRNKVGFVYNKSDFAVLNRFYYQTEGWGLTTVNDRILMSDGSNVLYFCDPEMFSVVSRLEVYDDEKKVDQLNELEYINGEIWANIWMTDLIARIDPASGRVNSYIDLSKIFPEPGRREVNADVLNGIAWDPERGRIFVTGKRWPELYEIKVIE